MNRAMLVLRAVRAHIRSSKAIWLLVAAPLALVSLYLFAIASDIYVSEAKLIVHKDLAAPSKASAVSPSSQETSRQSYEDALILAAFITSRDMLVKLDDQAGLKAHYQSGNADIGSRLSASASFERFYSYSQEKITVVIDEASSVLTVAVQAFDPAYARDVCVQLIRLAESFINDTNAQIARERMHFYEKEVVIAQKKMSAARAELIRLQDRHHLLDPAAEGRVVTDVVTSLELEIVKLTAELQRLRSYSTARAPEVMAATERIRALEAQVAAARSRQAQSEGNSMNTLVADVQAAQLAAELATGEYQSAVQAREQARQEALRQLKHLVVISAPGLPDDARYPRRGYVIASFLIALLVAYGIGRMIWTVILDHRS